MTAKSDVNGNQSKCNDSESDSYVSDDGDHNGETEGSSVDSIDGTLADGDENRPPQRRGKSHITVG